MGGISLDFFAQLVYYHAKVFRFLGVVRTPDSLQQPLMRKRLSFLHHKCTQDIKFFWREVDPLTPHVHYPSLEIDAQFRSLNFRKGLTRVRASERSSNTCQQFAHGEGFYDVIIGPGIQGKNLVPLRISD